MVRIGTLGTWQKPAQALESDGTICWVLTTSWCLIPTGRVKHLRVQMRTAPKGRTIRSLVRNMAPNTMSFIVSVAFSFFKIGYKLSGVLQHQKATSASVSNSMEMDLTGRITMRSDVPETRKDADRAIVLPYFPSSLAHSFWRAQELSLFRRASASFERPILDFGCGDGSFSSSIFDSIEYGVDIDEEALLVAKQYELYDRLFTLEQLQDQLPPASVSTVFSCSVLEHTVNLCDCISEIARILKPGARFHISVPSPAFTKQMTTLIDESFANAVNSFMFHRNLLSDTEWQRLLEKHSLHTNQISYFQPIEFTQQYFCLALLGSRGVGQLPGLGTLRRLFWKCFSGMLIDRVAASIDFTASEGANFFIEGYKT